MKPYKLVLNNVPAAKVRAWIFMPEISLKFAFSFLQK